MSILVNYISTLLSHQKQHVYFVATYPQEAG